ncbi:SO2930 family diheme c-type cytochrome [Mesorhizobium sp. NPDC059054]|uniref:SO2930 family diheme c-type cytochrome n=1 Tax=Mesorhizobium sp. NPDC059054 TaxID=3346711 RepID=UPI003678B62D
MNSLGYVRSLIAAMAAVVSFGTPAQAISDTVVLAATPPKQLSEFGFFEDLQKQMPAPGVVPFRLATPLFSDGAEKFRFVYLPKGQAAKYDPVEAFDFPVGTALIKTFAFPADYRKAAEKLRLIETRVLLHHADGWQAWAYLWNDQQTDATLKIAGAKVAISTIGRNGMPLSFEYSVPNKNQCKACHAFNGKITPLGPKARNLNTDYAYAGGSENQIAHWAAASLLSGAPDLAEIPAAADWRDVTAPLDKRARTWLDVNCAHCHRAEGPASNTGLFLTYGEDVPVRYGVLKRPAAAGRGSGDREFDIVPGEPDRSILTYRVESTVPGVMMPELGRHIADAEAVKLLAEWIASLR